MIKCNKEYTIYKVVHGKTSKGINYTNFKIKESVKDDNSQGGWKQIYYRVCLWIDCPDCHEKGLVTFKTIDGVQMRETTYNGRTTMECTIFPNKEGVFFKDTEDSLKGEQVNANPWGNEDLPF